MLELSFLQGLCYIRHLEWATQHQNLTSMVTTSSSSPTVRAPPTSSSPSVLGGCTKLPSTASDPSSLANSPPSLLVPSSVCAVRCISRATCACSVANRASCVSLSILATYDFSLLSCDTICICDCISICSSCRDAWYSSLRAWMILAFSVPLSCTNSASWLCDVGRCGRAGGSEDVFCSILPYASTSRALALPLRNPVPSFKYSCS
mmetsp:Transcript_16524/g.45765  ORF Transcript_16524/g.45765 Transcript_16524/m.45765 type:complete len:206 (-) Transcript_16524:44-661(-)